jgi:hypothetical protein
LSKGETAQNCLNIIEFEKSHRRVEEYPGGEMRSMPWVFFKYP